MQVSLECMASNMDTWDVHTIKCLVGLVGLLVPVPCTTSSVARSPGRRMSGQVYGSYKYIRVEMDRLRPGAALAEAVEFSGDLLASPGGGTRRVGPFTMKPHTALRYGYCELYNLLAGGPAAKHGS